MRFVKGGCPRNRYFPLKNVFVFADFEDEGRILVFSVDTTVIHGDAEFPVIFSPLDFFIAQRRMIIVFEQPLDTPIKFFLLRSF